MGSRYQVYALGLHLAATVLLAQSAQPAPAFGQAAGLIQRMPLTDLAVYSVGISDLIPTTILLPDPPQTFTGVGFTKDDSKAAPVFIEHQPGTTWFTVRALMPDAAADLNILLNGKAYSFHFYLSRTPHRTLTLFTPKAQEIGAATRSPRITVERLIAILDEAKAYLSVRQHYPNLYRPIQFSAPGSITPYRDFKVVTDMLWKFPSDDTIVFRVIFLNEAPHPLRYDPQIVGARVRGSVVTYWKSISDLDGFVPAAKRVTLPDGTVKVSPGQAFGYFAITGNPDGSKAGLSLKNAFDILVKRVASEPAIPADAIAPKAAAKPTA